MKLITFKKERQCKDIAKQKDISSQFKYVKKFTFDENGIYEQTVRQSEKSTCTSTCQRYTL